MYPPRFSRMSAQRYGRIGTAVPCIGTAVRYIGIAIRGASKKLIKTISYRAFCALNLL